MKSLVVALIVSFFITRFVFAVIKKKEESILREQDMTFICERLASLLSFEWKFFEQLCEELFTEDTLEFRQVLERLLGEHQHNKESQLKYCHALMTVLDGQDLVEVETVVYSRAALQANPYVFNLLPEWRRKECEYFLEAYKQYPDDQVLEIINHTKNDIDYLPAKDVGEKLIRVKKSMNYKPDDDDPKEGIQNSFLRPGFNLT